MQPLRDEISGSIKIVMVFAISSFEQFPVSSITNRTTSSNMQFKIISALAFTTLVAAGGSGPTGPTILPPFPGNPLPTVKESNCGSNQFECCKAAQVPTGPQASAALSRLGISTGSVGGLVGLNCYLIVGGNWCSDTPLCCTNTGNVGVACNPLNQNQ